MKFSAYSIPPTNTRSQPHAMANSGTPWFNAARLKTRQLLLLLHLHEQRSVLRAAEAAS
ncbi:galactose-binding protein, partial [Xanthomonas citri pv. citri]